MYLWEIKAIDSGHWPKSYTVIHSPSCERLGHWEALIAFMQEAPWYLSKSRRWAAEWPWYEVMGLRHNPVWEGKCWVISPVNAVLSEICNVSFWKEVTVMLHCRSHRQHHQVHMDIWFQVYCTVSYFCPVYWLHKSVCNWSPARELCSPMYLKSKISINLQ
jgi:hypothetical protein